MNTRSKASSTFAKTYIHKESVQVMDMPIEQSCPCGGGQSCIVDRRWVGDWVHEDNVFINAGLPGQSCIVDRRWVGDWVHEDNVFINAGLPIRKNCFACFTSAQQKQLGKYQ